MSRQVIGALALGCMILTTGALTACSESPEAKMRGLIIADCRRSAGLSNAACDCTYEKLAERYTLDELQVMTEPQLHQVSPEIEEMMYRSVEIMMYCQAHHR